MEKASASEAFYDLIERLGTQHEALLKQTAEAGYEAVLAENQRLSQEVVQLRALLTSKKAKARQPPPIPALPLALEWNTWEQPGHVEVQKWEVQPANVVSSARIGGKEHTWRTCGTWSELEAPFSPAESGMDPSAPPSRQRRMRTSLTTAEQLDGKLRAKERRRLRALLGLDEDDKYISAAHLCTVLQARTETFKLDQDTVKAIIEEFKALPEDILAVEGCGWVVDAGATDGLISVDAVAQLVMLPDIPLFISPENQHSAEVLLAALKVSTVSEVIDLATKLASQRRIEQPVQTRASKCNWEAHVTGFVTVVSVINVATMGISVDRSPENVMWTIMDAVCTAVFLVEATLKLSLWGVSVYFCGEAAYWNWLDFTTTTISFMESIIDISLQVQGRNSQLSNTAKVVVILRVLRLVRLVRLMLVQSALLKELAKMLVGFVIGLPSLIWVLLLFLFVLYSVGLTFRLCFGPAEGQDYIGKCGPPDLMTDVSDPDCPIHFMYGEEFFGTLPKAMFTTFRFMLNDYSTRFGNSLIVAFSQGYGSFFCIVWVGFMIVVIFGFFNIITAIFVDSTTTGLKNSDYKRKYARQYERTYVKVKLQALVKRIQQICLELDDELDSERRRSSKATKRLSEKRATEHDFRLSQEDFVFVMEDPEVKTLLEELDVEIYNAEGLFDTFDPEGTGVITVPNLVQAVMRLRGNTQKNDVIASWVAIRSLHDKVDKFQLQIIEGLTKLDKAQAGMRGRHSQRSQIEGAKNA